MRCRLAGGLAWLGFLAVGTLGEQVRGRTQGAHNRAAPVVVPYLLRGVTRRQSLGGTHEGEREPRGGCVRGSHGGARACAPMQVKTRLEVAQEEQGTREVQGAPEVALPSGVVYQDLKVGGGSEPIKGYLAVVHYV